MKKRVTPDDTTAAEGKTIPRLHLREVSPSDDDGPYEGIGTDLHAARVETGVDIAAVADNLRISRDYLEAIEDGRFDDLPGGAYVYGFLRSYAEYLDLDPKSVISKYKSESEIPRAETKLAFPSPMDQGRLPTGRLLASSLVLAGLVYAGWYIISGGQQQSAEVVTPVPERFAAIIENSALPDSTRQAPAGIAAPVQGVDIAPAGPLEDALSADATQPPIPAPAAPAPQVASAEDAQVTDNASEPALPLRRREEQQVAAVTPEEILAAVTQEETLAAVAPEETVAPVRSQQQAAVARPAAPSVVNAPAAAPAPRRKEIEAPEVVAAELPPVPPGRPVIEPVRAFVEPVRADVEPVRAVVEPVRAVVEPVRADVRIAAATPTQQEISEEALVAEALAAASPTQQEISEEALVAEALAAAPLIEQTPLAAPAPRVVPTEPAFLAAERAQAKEREERRRRELAAEEVQRTGNQSAAAVRPPKIAPYSDGIDVAELLAAPEPQTSSQDAETIRLAAARRISELTNDNAAANGAVRSFPVPPPIPAGTQTAALDRTGGYVPQVFGASNGDSRVIIEAKLESWVQVRGLSGETLLTRILRVGDKYLVPNRPNLVMMTGNAGALKIIVDGKEIGPLGPPGAVLRDVSLEPSQLLARAAAQ